MTVYGKNVLLEWAGKQRIVQHARRIVSSDLSKTDALLNIAWHVLEVAKRADLLSHPFLLSRSP